MSTSLDTPTSAAGSWDRFRVLLDEHRADCVRQREEALAECAQSVPDPVAQRRSADLQVTIDEIDAALARIAVGTYGRCHRLPDGDPGGAAGAAPVRGHVRLLHGCPLTCPHVVVRRPRHGPARRATSPSSVPGWSGRPPPGSCGRAAHESPCTSGTGSRRGLVGNAGRLTRPWWRRCPGPPFDPLR